MSLCLHILKERSVRFKETSISSSLIATVSVTSRSLIAMVSVTSSSLIATVYVTSSSLIATVSVTSIYIEKQKYIII